MKKVKKKRIPIYQIIKQEWISNRKISFPCKNKLSFEKNNMI